MSEIFRSRAPIFLKEKPKILRVDVNLCAGCQACAMACSLVKEGVFSLAKSRIHIYTNESKCFSVPTICEHCIDPPCIPACPVNAITRDDISGIVKIDEEVCTGCGECENACPFNSIRIRDGIALKCDLCGGDPECVKVCYPRALQYVENQPATIRNKVILAEERLRGLDLLKKDWGSEK